MIKNFFTQISGNKLDFAGQVNLHDVISEEGLSEFLYRALNDKVAEAILDAKKEEIMALVTPELVQEALAKALADRLQKGLE